MCHGAKGLADSRCRQGDESKARHRSRCKEVSEAQMIDAVHNGMGKMQPYKDKLTDAQIKDAVEYFRTFAK